MAALDFPASPTIGQTYTANGKTWKWDGVSWNSFNVLIAAGSNTQIQFNNSGAFGASSNLTWNGSTLATTGFSYTGTLTGGTGVIAIGTNQIYKDSSGNVGIGVTDFSTSGANAKFAVAGNINLNDSAALAWGGGTGRVSITGNKAAGTLVFSASNTSGSTTTFNVSSDGQYIWNAGATERLRIDSSGNLLVGTTSATGQFVKFQAASNVCLGIANATFTAGSITFNAINDTNTANIPLDIRCSQFYITSGVSAGSGTSTLKFQASGAVTYDTSSERYKDNIRDSLYGLSDVLALRSAMFEYKADGRTDVGLIAEEVLPVIPELVSLNKDGLPESVAYDRFVSVLVKAIQELHARILTLEEGK